MLAQDLPPDILEEIFIQCLPDNIFEFPQPNFTVAPLILCRICSPWRVTAISFRQLWREFAVVLEYVSLKSYYGGGFLKRKAEVLRVWSSRMGMLPASIHLIRNHASTTILNRDELITFPEFFNIPAILSAELLSLYDFSSHDFSRFNKFLKELSFNDLRILAIGQPPGREDSTVSLQRINAPGLRRLYLNCSMNHSNNPGAIVGMFAWENLTHLAAAITIARMDWYHILKHCTSLESGLFNLEFVHQWGQDVIPSGRETVVHQRLQSLVIQCAASDMDVIFRSLLFPSMKNLRLFNPASQFMISIPLLNKLLFATPSLVELHLRSCIGFGFPDFMSAGADPEFSPLSKYIPHLRILVIDSIGYRIPFASLPEDLVTLLESQWLIAGWTIDNEKRIEFVLDKGIAFSNTIIKAMDAFDENNIGRIPFRVRSFYEPGGRWKWNQPTGVDLRDRWDAMIDFSSYGQ